MTALNPTRKHPQLILAVQDDFFAVRPDIFNGILTKTDILQFEDEIHSSLILKERNSLERDPRYRQLLPYVLLRHVDKENGETYFFTYRRTKLVGEERLAGNISIGLGGHIDLWDIASPNDDSVIGLKDTLVSAIEREVTEELLLADENIDFVEDISMIQEIGGFSYTILDTTNDVGKVHVGLVHIIDIEEKDYLDKFSCKEEELETIGFRTAKNLLETEENIENWTRFLLEEFAKQ